MPTISTFLGLQTALRGLLAHQRALDVTSHNVTNANTAGYTRQEAVLGASLPLELMPVQTQTFGGAQLGTGVEVHEYRRLRDAFLDLQARASATSLGYAEARSTRLGQVEEALAEPSDNGINAGLAAFFDAWAKLANNPESTAARQAVLSQAAALAQTVRDLDARLAQIASDAQGELAQLAGAGGEVDRIAREIAQLNVAIARAVQLREQPNDLADRRDALIDRLAQLGRVQVQDDPARPGSVTISFGDAPSPLVTYDSVTWPQTLTAPDGRVGGLLAVASSGGTIDQYRAQLATFARNLADAVNTLHGTTFFSYTPGNEAATLAVAIASPSAVRAGSSGAAGANDVALAIAALRTQPGGPAEEYGRLVDRIANDARSAQNDVTRNSAIADAAEQRRQSVHGVSLDEEMAALIRFQRGYQASARALTTLDETLEVLINRTGRVGL